MSANNDCPVCDGASCVVCYHSGEDRALNFCVPYSSASNPWSLVRRDDLIHFLRRVYNAAPDGSEQQFRDLVESYYLAAALGADVGREHGRGEARND